MKIKTNDPQTLISLCKDWLEDAEIRLEDGRVEQSRESLIEAIQTYNYLPPGYSCAELEKSLVEISEKIYNNLASKQQSGV